MLNKNLYIIMLFLLSCVLFTGCGFYLRGTNNYKTNDIKNNKRIYLNSYNTDKTNRAKQDEYLIKPVALHIECNNDIMKKNLIKVLAKFNYIEISTQENLAEIKVTISDEIRHKEMINTNNYGRISSFMLDSAFNLAFYKYCMIDCVLDQEFNIVSFGKLQYNDSLILANQQDEQIIYENLLQQNQNKMIDKILFYIDYYIKII